MGGGCGINLPHAVVVLCKMREYRPRNILKSTGEVGAEEEVKGTSFPLLLFGGYINSIQKQVFLFGTYIL